MSVEIEPAVAATGTTVVVRGFFDMVHADVPAGLRMELTGCDVPGPERAGVKSIFLNGSTPGAPLGDVFWAVDGEQPNLADGPSRAYSDLSDFTSASLDVLNQNPIVDGATQSARIYAWADGGDDTMWSGIATVGQVVPGSGWETVSGDASTVFTWLQYPGTPDSQPISNASFTGTIAQLEAQKSGGDAEGRVGISMGCGGGQFGFDAPTFGLGDASTTFDLESTGATMVDPSVSSFLIGGGQTDGIQCQLRDSDDYTIYQQADLTLQARSAGTHRWRYLATAHQGQVSTNSTPVPAEFQVTPTLNTAYRCLYTGPEPSTSRQEPVLVYDRIWATPRRVRVPQGQNIVIRGHVLPVEPGRRITLYRGRDAVSHTRLDAAGHYRLETPARHQGQVLLVVATHTTRKHVGSLVPLLIRVVRH